MAIEFIGPKWEDVNIDLLLGPLYTSDYEQIARQLLAELITIDINYMRETVGTDVRFSVVENEIKYSSVAAVRYIQIRMQHMVDEIARAINNRTVTLQAISLNERGLKDVEVTID